MVLASTPDTTGLKDLAQLANNIMEVATPIRAAVRAPQITSEVEQLHTEVARLKDVKSLSKRESSNTCSICSCSPSLTSGTMNVSEMMLANADPLFQVGKSSQLLMATSTGQQPSRLFYVTDKLSGFHFLVNTGAETSVIPPSPSKWKTSPETLRPTNYQWHTNSDLRFPITDAPFRITMNILMGVCHQ